MTDVKAKRRVSLGYRINRLYRLDSCMLDSWLSEYDLCSGQISYVLTIVENEGMTQEQLSAHIQVCPAATARMLKNMEKADLAIRKENPDNRRQKLVYPTDRAKQLYTVLIPLLDRHNQVMLKGFSEEEKKLVLNLLRRIMVNIQNAMNGDT